MRMIFTAAMHWRRCTVSCPGQTGMMRTASWVLVEKHGFRLRIRGARGLPTGRRRFLTHITERTRIFKSGSGISFQDGARTVELPGDTLVSMNLWGFRPSFFDHLDASFRLFLERNVNDPKAEFFLPSVIDSLIQARKARVSVLSTDSRWFGITYQEDRPAVEKSIRQLVTDGIYPGRLWQAG